MAAGDFDFFEEVITSPDFGMPQAFGYGAAKYDMVDHGETIEKQYLPSGVRDVLMRMIDVRVSDFSGVNPAPKQTCTVTDNEGVTTYRIHARKKSSTGKSYKLTLIQPIAD